MKNQDIGLMILREIRRNQGPVGAKVLSEALSIPQATVGRALAKLEAAELICPVSNKGRVLTDLGTRLLNQQNASNNKRRIAHELVDLSFSGDPEQLLEVMSIREMLEPNCARLAAQNATAEEIETLENYAFAHRYQLSQNLCANQEDLGFHLTIARISANQTLLKILELLLTDNNAYVEFSKAGDADRESQITAHFQVLDAIRNHDCDTAQRAMTAHLNKVIQDVCRVYSLN